MADNMGTFAQRMASFRQTSATEGLPTSSAVPVGNLQPEGAAAVDSEIKIGQSQGSLKAQINPQGGGFTSSRSRSQSFASGKSFASTGPQSQSSFQSRSFRSDEFPTRSETGSISGSDIPDFEAPEGTSSFSQTSSQSNLNVAAAPNPTSYGSEARDYGIDAEAAKQDILNRAMTGGDLTQDEMKLLEHVLETGESGELGLTRALKEREEEIINSRLFESNLSEFPDDRVKFYNLNIDKLTVESIQAVSNEILGNLFYEQLIMSVGSNQAFTLSSEFNEVLKLPEANELVKTALSNPDPKEGLNTLMTFLTSNGLRLTAVTISGLTNAMRKMHSNTMVRTALNIGVTVAGAAAVGAAAGVATDALTHQFIGPVVGSGIAGGVSPIIKMVLKGAFSKMLGSFTPITQALMSNSIVSTSMYALAGYSIAAGTHSLYNYLFTYERSPDTTIVKGVQAVYEAARIEALKRGPDIANVDRDIVDKMKAILESKNARQKQLNQQQLQSLFLAKLHVLKVQQNNSAADQLAIRGLPPQVAYNEFGNSPITLNAYRQIG
jgi:hypothetical protein